MSAATPKRIIWSRLLFIPPVLRGIGILIFAAQLRTGAERVPEEEVSAGDRTGFCLPVSVTEWGVAGKAVSQGLEFGFCFQSIDIPLGRHGESTERASGSPRPKEVHPARFELSASGSTTPSPDSAGLCSLGHVRSQRIPLHVTEHRQTVFIGLHRKRFAG